MKQTTRYLMYLACGASMCCCSSHAEDMKLAPTGAGDSIDLLLNEFEHARSFWEQFQVGERLIATGRRGLIRKMKPFLDNPERMRKCNAAFVMAKLGDARGVEIIVHELEDVSTNRAVVEEVLPMTPSVEGQIRQDRYYAALLLGKLCDDRAVPALIRATRDAGSGVRLSAAISLGQIGDPRAIPALKEMAEAFPRERLWAGYGLAALGEESGFDILAVTALNDPSWSERRHAINALATIARTATRDREGEENQRSQCECMVKHASKPSVLH